MEPYFNETGSNCPSILPGSEQQELCELAVRSVQVSLGGGGRGGPELIARAQGVCFKELEAE